MSRTDISLRLFHSTSTLGGTSMGTAHIFAEFPSRLPLLLVTPWLTIVFLEPRRRRLALDDGDGCYKLKSV
jgi:hypothetical protein